MDEQINYVYFHFFCLLWFLYLTTRNPVELNREYTNLVFYDSEVRTVFKVCNVCINADMWNRILQLKLKL